MGDKNMALKKIGRQEYLGANNGGMCYFVRYCPVCREKVYLTTDELKEFLLNTYTPRLWALVKHYLKVRISLPKVQLKVEWENPREAEIVALNERIELSGEKSLVQHDPKLFKRNFFEKKYSTLGGIKKLEELILSKSQPVAIGKCFGFSRQRAFEIMRSYRFQKVI